VVWLPTRRQQDRHGAACPEEPLAGRLIMSTDYCERDGGENGEAFRDRKSIPLEEEKIRRGRPTSR